MSDHVGCEALFSTSHKNTGHVSEEAHIISNAFMASASATAPSSAMAFFQGPEARWCDSPCEPLEALRALRTTRV